MWCNSVMLVSPRPSVIFQPGHEDIVILTHQYRQKGNFVKDYMEDPRGEKTSGQADFQGLSTNYTIIVFSSMELNPLWAGQIKQ